MVSLSIEVHAIQLINPARDFHAKLPVPKAVRAILTVLSSVIFNKILASPLVTYFKLYRARRMSFRTNSSACSANSAQDEMYTMIRYKRVPMPDFQHER